MKMKNILLSMLLLCSLSLFSQKNYIPSPVNLKNREQFQDNKFGVFIHWGIYSMMADGEWIMYNKRLNHDEYSNFAAGFFPSKFNAAQWVKDVKEAGVKYICITSRHHDGFSMFDTQFSDYNIVKSTPFKRDPIRELAEECKKQGIKLHFYYSLLDWGRADYNPNGPFITKTEETKKAKWETYHQFMKNQLTELLTNYGEIGAIWFDGMWDKKDFDWRLDEIYSHIHSIQPGCLIINNHHLKPIEGEDVQTFERDLPGQNTAGYSAGSEIGQLPLETCETMNTSWGYKINDTNYKSEKALIHYLVKAAGNNANLLMNVGPRPDGTFPDVAVKRFAAMGEWLKTFGKTIYSTRGGMISQRKWGVTTQKDNRLFVHILDLQENALFLPITDQKIKSAKKFVDGKKLRFTQSKEGVLIYLDKIPDEIDYIVELNIKN